MPEFKDLAGQRFGRLVAIRPAGINRSGQYRWECQCDCGKTHVTTSYRLRSGTTKSCGCYMRERAAEVKTLHGGRNTRLYNIWNSMKARCYNDRQRNFRYYGGRGIRVCDEWLHDFDAFRSWAEDSGYNAGASFGECTLDRIDVNGDYQPTNCRWVSHAEQQKNRRPWGTAV